VAFVPSLAAVFLNLRKLSQVLAGRTIHVFLRASLENVIVVLLVSHRRKKYWQKPYAYYPMIRGSFQSSVFFVSAVRLGQIYVLGEQLLFRPLNCVVDVLVGIIFEYIGCCGSIDLTVNIHCSYIK